MTLMIFKNLSLQRGTRTLVLIAGMAVVPKRDGVLGVAQKECVAD